MRPYTQLLTIKNLKILTSKRLSSCIIEQETIYLHDTIINVPEKTINRIKVILVEKRLTSKWLAGQLKRTESTVSRWGTNEKQLPIETFVEIASILDVDVKNLLASTKMK
jgi:DNA-binding Xre family transcriptional regulator